MDAVVKKKFDVYPSEISSRLLSIRQLIFDVVKEEDLGEVEETLKWGEPSFVVKQGSPVRFDWKANNPEQFSIYFNCQTSLVETFKEIYPHLFIFEGNRQMIFKLDEAIPVNELKHCIGLAFQYHKLKHLPLLGV